MEFISASARFAAVLIGLALLSAPAQAQGTAEERSACMGDAFRFCASDIPDVPKIEACLVRNKDHLAPACRAEFRWHEPHKTKLRAEHFR